MSQPAETSFRVGLTQEERELYSRLFKALDAGNSGVITGEKARATFEKSGLPANILGEIWQLADDKNLGFLTQFGFCHAMRLIGYTQAGNYPTAQLAETPGPLPKFADLPLPSQPLRSQSTSSSLLHTQPSALIPQNTATQQSMPQAPIASVSAADYEKFSQIYVKTTGSKVASLDGNAAKQILMKAKLPTAVLGQIWSLVDVNNRGYLDLPAFVMAMHLIHGLLSGTLKQMPPFLPEYVWKSVDVPENVSQGDRQVSYSSINSQSSTIRRPPVQAPTNVIAASASSQSEWAVSSSQKQQFDSIFDNLDKAKTGALAADQVASFLMTSRLDQQDLATVWDLADIQNTGVFTKLEFGIALFLINRRRSGQPLPDVVPQELISSLSQSVNSQPQSQVTQQAHAVPVTPSVSGAPKSNMDELADIFAAPSAPAASTSLHPGSPQKNTIQPRSSSSDLTHVTEPPKLTQHLTSSFKPSSTFGQSLVAQGQPPKSEPPKTEPLKTEPANLIGDDVRKSAVPEPRSVPDAPVPGQFNASSDARGAEIPAASRQNTVDYEALRSVPAPPKPRSTEPAYAAPEPAAPRSNTLPRNEPTQNNDDLLADSEVSGKLSEATSDIANFSNQIKSLTTQTSNLHEKKLRAEKELARILTLKEEINTKLKLLRTSYASEAKSVEQVEFNLANAKEELDALRSEASIAEAKFNNISNEFNEKQLAVEEKQKVNSSLREKLGNLNAEIAALEGEHERKALEHTRLSNDVNVKKSQAQVALVKVDELRRNIADLESSHSKYSGLILQHENERAAAEQHAAELSAKHKGLSSDVNELQSKHSLLAAGAIAGVGAGVGAVVASVAGKAHSGNDVETVKSQPVQSREIEDDFQSQPVHAFTSPQLDSAGSNSVGDDTIRAQSSGFAPETTAQSDSAEFSAAGLVDEVRRHPAEDLTGLDDVKTSEHTDSIFEGGHAEGIEQPKESFTSQNYDSDVYDQGAYQDTTQRESVSSAATGSYKHAGDTEVGETPITSPANSDYRFQTSNAGVVGGLVGMPGVLVGVQRTDSLTSSVQNNPSMSVRDDNIDEISDRDTLEDAAAFSEHPSREQKQSEGRLEDSSEGERISSGVESFEIVNAEEAKGVDEVKGVSRAPESATHPLAQSYRASESSSGSNSQQIEEFPPVRELDYDESSSDESEQNVAMEDEFDDAQDAFTSRPEPPSYDSGDEFDDLKPATIETAAKQPNDEFFDEDFDNLQLADDDHQEEIDTHEVSIDDHFTGADETNIFNQPVSGFPSSTAGVSNENDEWEQLFAGFGNAAPVAQEVSPVDATHDSAVSELVAMGFDKETVIEALEKNNFDVESATNYLLDHA